MAERVAQWMGMLLCAAAWGAASWRIATGVGVPATVPLVLLVAVELLPGRRR